MRTGLGCFLALVREQSVVRGRHTLTQGRDLSSPSLAPGMVQRSWRSEEPQDPTPTQGARPPGGAGRDLPPALSQSRGTGSPHWSHHRQPTEKALAAASPTRHPPSTPGH